MKDCWFCEGSERKIWLENALATASLDNHPVSPGHTLVVPKRHVKDWWGTTLEERLAILALLDEAKKHIDEEHSPDGYNIGMNLGEAAGQSIFHLHVHLIPRYKGDVPNPRGGVRGIIPGKQNY